MMVKVIAEEYENNEQTLEASAELNLFNLCLARRRKIKSNTRKLLNDHGLHGCTRIFFPETKTSKTLFMR